jgi:two-component system, NtrC family, sensor kinase
MMKEVGKGSRPPPPADIDADQDPRVQAAKQAEEALLGRPRISLRFQIYLAFFLAFLLAVGIGTVLIVATYKVESKIGFLEIANDFAVQIEDLRRLEKNFFLYGTGLDAARQTVDVAIETLGRNEEEISQTLGKRFYSEIVENTERYEHLLSQLFELDATVRDVVHEQQKKALESELRKQGRKLVSLSMRFVKQEKRSMSEAIGQARRIHIYSIGLLLITMVFIAYALGSRLLRNINRFEAYARRIASGDFTPIKPTRSFRDEFTALALAINDMLMELERHESALIQSHKMQAVGTLTAGVAHELNNPLNNITLTAHMLLEEYGPGGDENMREMIGDLIAESDRAKAIVRNLLDFARESGTQLEPLDLARLVGDTVKLAANELKVSGVRVVFKEMGNLPRIHGDMQQLRQVFLNLILNAAAASKKGDTIEILVLPADEPGEVAVKVVDTGEGIPEEIQHRIFDPFFTTKDRQKGTGLGLSVSEGIVAKHGGRIRMTSRVGKGSTFTVILPVTTIDS